MSTAEQKSQQPAPDRKHLTFEQAEGVVPLPSQLKRGEISQEFRARIWAVLRWHFERAKVELEYTPDQIGQPWHTILQDAQAEHHHSLVDFPNIYRDAVYSIRSLIEQGSWSQVLGWLEFVLKHRFCPVGFFSQVNAVVVACRLCYRVVDEHVICPIASDEEQQTIERAFIAVATPQFHGARTHLRNAAEELTAGHYADSVRESIHAVESVAKVLAGDPDVDLSKALVKLENSATIHPAMKQGFVKLYAYTSDEDGIRHASIEAGAAVDETDALFMIGACAAFVSYMINKARKA